MFKKVLSTWNILKIKINLKIIEDINSHSAHFIEIRNMLIMSSNWNVHLFDQNSISFIACFKYPTKSFWSVLRIETNYLLVFAYFWISAYLCLERNLANLQNVTKSNFKSFSCSGPEILSLWTHSISDLKLFVEIWF